MQPNFVEEELPKSNFVEEEPPKSKLQKMNIHTVTKFTCQIFLHFLGFNVRNSTIK
jgi:hypothetical protein